MTKRVLCIGGPLDKTTVPDEGLPFFIAINLGKPPKMAFALGLDTTPAPDDTGPSPLYNRRWISCDGEEAIVFYTVDGIGEYAAIVRVFTAYAKGDK